MIHKKDIRDLSHPEMVFFIESIGAEKYRAAQIFDWIYKKGAESFDAMSNLSQDLREKLKEHFAFQALTLIQKNVAADLTTKFLFGLYDQQRIETVLIPAHERSTICVSTQAGCKFHCQFCASGIGGWDRNLTCSEIVSQILYVRKQCQETPLSNIVFMGVGEPLDNYDALIKAIRLINSDEGTKMGARRFTISTCGLVPQIKKLAQENIQVELAVSLHGSNNDARNVLMPVNKKYPVPDLIEACKEYIQATNRQITFEYILIKGLTCTQQAAEELGQLLAGMTCKLNLIPYNPVAEFAHETPSKMEIILFQDKLTRLGVHATLRMPRGRDAAAACGQLRHSTQYNKS